VKSASMLLSLVAGVSLLACGAGADSPRPPGSAGSANGLGGSVGAGGFGNAGSSGTAAGGSAGASGGGTAGSISTNTGNGMDVDCGRKTFNVQPKPAEILIVLDRSASMLDPPDKTTTASKWSLVVPALNQVVTDTNATVFWGLKTFPEGAVNCGVTNKIDVSIAPMNAPIVTGTVTATTAEGDGTPTSAAVGAAVTYLKTLTDNNPKYLLLATDGVPSCPDGDPSRVAAVKAVTDAATAGFHTFVIGVATSTSATATTALNQMAQAGLEPRDDPNPLATRYYSAGTQDEIVNSLKQITGVVASCAFGLGGPPPVPDNIAVKVDGMKAPQSATDGWAYTSPDDSTLQIYGSWCDRVKASVDSVQIIFACKGDVIN
jgi:hypothetical protein